MQEQRIKIELTAAAQDYLAQAGYEPSYGARPLKRVIQREVENPVATKLLENVFVEGDTILVTVKNDQLCFTKAGAEGVTEGQSDPDPEPAAVAVAVEVMEP